MWETLREQNARKFEGKEHSVPDLKLLFLKTLFEWQNASGLLSFSSLSNMIDSCVLCV
jgi:hypothetical protein